VTTRDLLPAASRACRCAW